MPVRPLRTTTRLLSMRVHSGGQWLPTEFVNFLRDGNNVQAIYRTLAFGTMPSDNAVTIDLRPDDHLSINIRPINDVSAWTLT